MLGQLGMELLLQLNPLATGMGQVVDGCHRQMESVQPVSNRHIKGRGGRTFLLEPVYMQVLVIMAPIGEPVNQQRIAVVGKNNRFVRRKQGIEVGKP